MLAGGLLLFYVIYMKRWPSENLHKNSELLPLGDSAFVIPCLVS